MGCAFWSGWRLGLNPNGLGFNPKQSHGFVGIESLYQTLNVLLFRRGGIQPRAAA